VRRATPSRTARGSTTSSLFGSMQAEYSIQSRQRGHGSRDVQRQLDFVGLRNLHFQACYFEWVGSAHPIVSVSLT